MQDRAGVLDAPLERALKPAPGEGGLNLWNHRRGDPRVLACVKNFPGDLIHQMAEPRKDPPAARQGVHTTAYRSRSDPKRRKGFASKHALSGGNFGGNFRELVAQIT